MKEILYRVLVQFCFVFVTKAFAYICFTRQKKKRLTACTLMIPSTCSVGLIWSVKHFSALNVSSEFRLFFATSQNTLHGLCGHSAHILGKVDFILKQHFLAGRHWRASTTTTSAGTVQPPRATAPCSQPALRFFPIGHWMLGRSPPRQPPAASPQNWRCCVGACEFVSRDARDTLVRLRFQP